MRAPAQGDGIAGIKRAGGEHHQVAEIERQVAEMGEVAARRDQPDAQEGNGHARDLHAA